MTAIVGRPTQINVRIGSELKERGDKVFAAAGLTASEAIRKLYQLAVANELQPEVVAQRLDARAEEVAAQSISREKAELGEKLYAQGMERLGHAAFDDHEPNLSLDDLRALRAAEKFGIGEGA